MAFTQPVWSRIDEAHHYDFIAQLGHGGYPLADATLIEPETLRVMQSTGVYLGYAPDSYPVPDVTDMAPPPTGISARANAAWMTRHLWQLSYESAQSPLYYLAMAPVWWVVDHLGGPMAAIYTLRAINALLLAALAPMAVMVARVLAPSRHEVAVLAGLFAALLPGLDLNGTRISNDSLAAAVGGLLVLLTVRWTGSAWSWRRAALAGAILGAGVMVKLTVGGLILAVAVSALWPAAGRSLGARTARLALVAGVSFACTIPWFVLNRHLYGGLLPGYHTQRLSDALMGSLSAAFIPLDVAVFHISYWTGEPWGVLPLAAPFALLAALIAFAAPVGIFSLLRARVAPGPLLAGAAAVLGLAAVSLLLPATSGYEFAGPGRYAYPALPAAAALCAVGVVTVVRDVIARRALAIVYAAGAVSMLGLGAAGVPAPTPLGDGAPPSSAQVGVVTATGEADGFTILVDRAAYDAAAGATWFHVTVTNGAAEEAEWTVPPESVTGTSVVRGDYSRSTRLPGDLDPGQTVAGWLYVPVQPSNVRQGVVLRFTDVTTDGYRSIRDIVVRLAA